MVTLVDVLAVLQEIEGGKADGRVISTFGPFATMAFFIANCFEVVKVLRVSNVDG